MLHMPRVKSLGTTPALRATAAFALGHAANLRGGGLRSFALGAAAAVGSAVSEVETSAAAAPVEIKREDYKPPLFGISTVELDVNINPGQTVITSRIAMHFGGDSARKEEPLVLNGEDLDLQSVSINGKVLEPKTDYSVTSEGDLRILPHVLLHEGTFELSTTVAITPEKNTQLSGLYKSGSMYCTQCEAEGFRRITYFLDRPDVMATYRVRIEAPKEDYPILLSNGNKVEEGDAGSGRHFATWEDPFPKPSYLFAAVVADLGFIEDSFVTKSGRNVRLVVYSEKENVKKLGWAMKSLKAAMKWDEDKFGLEYDLDLFNIVAVNDFNMGAMENKGLNIFNSAYVLASADTATDEDYDRIEGVIGHEYFHNWTGNRVTCRDWFQLTLKEGLTVFRDQQFSADMGSAVVKRIEDVRTLRARQFPEDAGPLAHPIRPDSFISIDNFYTATVYIKGAEVIRMYHTLLGEEGFRKGMDLYFKRHDGQAVTCDDFRAAMADANEYDLTQFERWYKQEGTPVLTVTDDYDPAEGKYTLRLKQHIPSRANAASAAAKGRMMQEEEEEDEEAYYSETAEEQEMREIRRSAAAAKAEQDAAEAVEQQSTEAPQAPANASEGNATDASVPPPLHIPVAVGLLANGEEIFPTQILDFTETEQNFVFMGLPGTEKPTPSLLRGFSAPVKIKYDYSEEQLAHLMAYDSDPFNRWEAGQQLYTKVIMDQVQDQLEMAKGVPRSTRGRSSVPVNKESRPIPKVFLKAFKEIFEDARMDPSLKAYSITLPSFGTLAEEMEVIRPDVLRSAIRKVEKAILDDMGPRIVNAYMQLSDKLEDKPYVYSAPAAGQRRLRIALLEWLSKYTDVPGMEPEATRMCSRHFKRAQNMTDKVAGLRCLAKRSSKQEQDAMLLFYRQAKGDALVINKWFAIQSSANVPNLVDQARSLMEHRDFDWTNPNRVRAVVSSFANNIEKFHAADGSGYDFVADSVLKVDKINQQVAARMASSFSNWRRFNKDRQDIMKYQLQRIRDTPGISKDTYEVVTRCLS